MEVPRIETKEPQTGKVVRQVHPEAEGWFHRYRPFIAGVLTICAPEC